MSSQPSTRTLQVDSGALATAPSQRLDAAGLLVAAAQSAQYVRSLAPVMPTSRRAPYHSTRAIFVTDTLDRVLAEVFGSADDRGADAPSPGAERILSGA